MKLKTSRYSIQILLFIITILLCAETAFSADKWIRLTAPRFGVVSQLSEKTTRMWAKEFDNFISAMNQFYAMDDSNLVPLTIVIFKNKKQFKPYRNKTKSGQAEDVIGFFANFTDWSILGLPGLRGYNKTRMLIYHEALHWYHNSKRFNTPLWLEEGMAEVFSTFEVKWGKGRWGLPIQRYINYLNIKKMQPTEEFLFTSQDEALHKLTTYYPQAWAMSHYLMFGNGGKNRVKLSLFLSELGKKTTGEAFESAFGITYKEFDRELRDYVRGGRYGIAEVELDKTEIEMEVSPATDAMVQFALGRLAVAGDNNEKGAQHAREVISIMPSRPEGYELLAMASVDPEKQLEALDKAISLNSRDSEVYFMKAAILRDENWIESVMEEQNLKEKAAKEIAGMYKKSILLRPTRKSAYEGFAVALLNMNTYEEEDRKVLELGRRLFPEQGSILAGFAALDRMDGDMESFNRKLIESYNKPMHLNIKMKKYLVIMQKWTYYNWLYDQLALLMGERKFEEGEAFMAQQKSLSYKSEDLQEVIDNMDTVLYSAKQLYKATHAMNHRKYEEALAICEEMQKDENVSRSGKSSARRMISRIKRKMEENNKQ